MLLRIDLDSTTGPIDEHSVLSIDKEINKLSPLGLYPCDRKTMFGPAGAHAIYRNKNKDS